MLSKLLKYDLRKNMRWLWIIFVAALVAAGINRGTSELSKHYAVFKVINIIFDSVFYALIANCIIHPFIRSFMNFTKSVYGDEGYLTNTLPVSKNKILTSKYLTAIIETILGFATVVVAILIRYVSPTFFPTFKAILSMAIIGDFSIGLLLTLAIVLIVIEFLMYISIIFFSIVWGFRSNEKKILRSFLYTALMALCAIQFLSIVMIIVLVINGVEFASSTLTLTTTTMYSVLITGIVVYTGVVVLFYFLARLLYNKGINID